MKENEEEKLNEEINDGEMVELSEEEEKDLTGGAGKKSKSYEITVRGKQKKYYEIFNIYGLPADTYVVNRSSISSNAASHQLHIKFIKYGIEAQYDGDGTYTFMDTMRCNRGDTLIAVPLTIYCLPK